MINQKELKQLNYPVNLPEAFILALKEKWANITDRDIEMVRNAVKYDIAMNLEHSNNWVYALCDVLRALTQREEDVSVTEEKIREKVKTGLKLVK